MLSENRGSTGKNPGAQGSPPVSPLPEPRYRREPLTAEAAERESMKPPSRRITQSAAASAEVFCGKDLCSVPPAVLRFWLPRLPAPGSRSLRLPPLPVRSLPFRSRNPGPAPFLPCRRDLQRSLMLLQAPIRGGSPLPPCRKDLLKILFLPRSRCRTAVRTAGDLSKPGAKFCSGCGKKL